MRCTTKLARIAALVAWWGISPSAEYAQRARLLDELRVSRRLMNDDAFEWDEAKAVTNEVRHGVSFEAARKVFLDPFAVERLDDREDYGEDRFILIGIGRRRRPCCRLHGAGWPRPRYLGTTRNQARAR